MKKPKPKKLPKKPKSDNPDVLQRWLDKVEAIRKENTERLKEWEREKDKAEKLKKKVQSVSRSKKYK